MDRLLRKLARLMGISGDRRERARLTRRMTLRDIDALGGRAIPGALGFIDGPMLDGETVVGRMNGLTYSDINENPDPGSTEPPGPDPADPGPGNFDPGHEREADPADDSLEP